MKVKLQELKKVNKQSEWTKSAAKICAINTENYLNLAQCLEQNNLYQAKEFYDVIKFNNNVIDSLFRESKKVQNKNWLWKKIWFVLSGQE